MFFLLSKRKLRLKFLCYLQAVYRKNIRRPLEAFWSFLIGTLAFICLLLIFSYSPVVTTTTSILSYTFQKQHSPIEKTFAFIPGSVPNKFDRVDLQNLNILSFYDLPFDTDGSFVTDADGYSTFYGENANYLFHTARQNGAKVLATLTQTYNNDIIDFLNNDQAQQNLYALTAQTVSEAGIDGVTINVEFNGDTSQENKNKFSNFVNKFTQYMHNHISGSIVAVAIPNNINKNSLYDIKALADGSDNTLLIAYNFAVPETQNATLETPVFGGDKKEYQNIIKSAENKFLDVVPSNKLVMERAWYGNGNNLKLYSQDNINQSSNDDSQNTLNAPLSSDTIEKLIADVPAEAQNAARKNLPYIIDALKKENILNSNVLAYSLATIQHETAGTFEPLEEFKGRKSARRLGYEGGTNYFGRGFIQLTHLRNYETIGKRIGVGEQLVKNPALASRPDIAARVLAAYFKDYGIAELATNGNFVDARTLINPDYNGYTIAQIAYVYLNALV